MFLNAYIDPLTSFFKSKFINTKNLLIFSIIYLILGFSIYFITSGKPLSYLNNYGLNNLLDNLILSEGIKDTLI